MPVQYHQERYDGALETLPAVLQRPGLTRGDLWDVRVFIDSESSVVRYAVLQADAPTPGCWTLLPDAVRLLRLEEEVRQLKQLLLATSADSASRERAVADDEADATVDGGRPAGTDAQDGSQAQDSDQAEAEADRDSTPRASHGERILAALDAAPAEDAIEGFHSFTSVRNRAGLNNENASRAVELLAGGGVLTELERGAEIAAAAGGAVKLPWCAIRRRA